LCSPAWTTLASSLWPDMADDCSGSPTVSAFLAFPSSSALIGPGLSPCRSDILPTPIYRAEIATPDKPTSSLSKSFYFVGFAPSFFRGIIPCLASEPTCLPARQTRWFCYVAVFCRCWKVSLLSRRSPWFAPLSGKSTAAWIGAVAIAAVVPAVGFVHAVTDPIAAARQVWWSQALCVSRCRPDRCHRFCRNHHRAIAPRCPCPSRTRGLGHRNCRRQPWCRLQHRHAGLFTALPVQRHHLHRPLIHLDHCHFSRCRVFRGPAANSLVIIETPCSLYRLIAGSQGRRV